MVTILGAAEIMFSTSLMKKYTVPAGMQRMRSRIEKLPVSKDFLRDGRRILMKSPGNISESEFLIQALLNSDSVR